MSTPQYLIDIAVESGQEIDRRFPGLRQQNNEQWMQKVAYMSSLQDAKIGRKSRGGSARLSPDTVGIKTDINNQQNDPFYAVSIIRDNPPVNEWREPPLDYGLISGQAWFKADEVDLGNGTIPVPPVDPPSGNTDIKKLVEDVATIVGLVSNNFYELQKKISAIAGKL